jgi:hypothetical protein
MPNLNDLVRGDDDHSALQPSILSVLRDLEVGYTDCHVRNRTVKTHPGGDSAMRRRIER